MLYKPKFCCECADAIEKTDWKLSDSRRFCNSCATRHRFDEIFPKLILSIPIVIGILGFGIYLQKPEKPLNLVAVNPTVNSKPAAESRNSANVEVKPAVETTNKNSEISKAQPKSFVTTTNPDSAIRKINTQSGSATEAIYFCGAETQKGTFCTHRVKGGGRCWQHEGKPAMLPPDKLIASR